MLWEVEIFPKGSDAEKSRVADEYDLLTHSRQPANDAIAQNLARLPASRRAWATSKSNSSCTSCSLDPVAEVGRHSRREAGDIAAVEPC